VLLTEKLEAARLEPRPVDIRIGELVDRATTAARQTALAKGLRFDTRWDPERTVRTDVALTLSALQNLVDNAVKYIDTRRVDLVVELEPAGSWSVHVRDPCPGLSPEELRTIAGRASSVRVHAGRTLSSPARPRSLRPRGGAHRLGGRPRTR
jgi:signal transduction histidine kinase